MRISVTSNDIACGNRRDRTGCPLAIAASRASGEIVEVMGTGLIFHNGSHSEYFQMPRHVACKVRGYDEHGLMEPFSFEFVKEYNGPCVVLPDGERVDASTVVHLKALAVGLKQEAMA